MARRVRRLFRGGRIVDVAGGHGLLAHVMLLLDDSSPCAVVVDRTLPPSSTAVNEALIEAWPRLADRVEFLARPFDEIALAEADVVVASHACGNLTDLVLERAAAARARVAVLPCCYDLQASDTGGLSGWVEKTLAVDVVRACQLAGQGYDIWTQTIPATITPRNRLLLAAPATQGAASTPRRRTI